MARILIAWEFGQNLGHIGQILPLAAQLRARGHEVSLALKRDAASSRLPLAQGFACFEAPAIASGFARDAGDAHDGREPAENYADLLRLAGWSDAQALAKALGGWRSLFEVARPDLLICNAAPTAQLAARAAGIRTARLGTGYECPPPASPFPPMLHWRPVDREAMAGRERSLMARVGEAVRLAFPGNGGVEAAGLPELLGPHADFLCTLPVLDHYPRRAAFPRPPSGDARDGASGNGASSNAASSDATSRDAASSDGASAPGPAAPEYFGPLTIQEEGLQPRWPEGGGARIFAYLRPGFRAAPDIVRALREGPWAALLAMPGLPEAEARAMASARLYVANSAVKLKPALRDCAAVLTYGGHGTVCASLLAGKPVLNVPRNAEQLLVSRAAVGAGAGLIAAADIDGQDFPGLIARLVDDPGLHACARGIAGAGRGIVENGMPSLIASIEELARRPRAAQANGGS